MLAALRTALSRIRAVFSGRRDDTDFEQEMQSHLEMFTEENIRRGLSPGEARRQALIRFGGVTQLAESQREHRGLPLFETIFRDIRYAVRVLRKSPSFTAIAIITLALGIGINTTLFTAFAAVALTPLPVTAAVHIVRFVRWFQSRGMGDIQYAFSYPEYV